MKKIMYNYYYSESQKKRRRKKGYGEIFKDGIEYTEMIPADSKRKPLDKDSKLVHTALGITTEA